MNTTNRILRCALNTDDELYIVLLCCYFRTAASSIRVMSSNVTLMARLLQLMQQTRDGTTDERRCGRRETMRYHAAQWLNSLKPYRVFSCRVIITQLATHK